MFLAAVLVLAPVAANRYLLEPEWIEAKLLPPLERRLGRSIGVKTIRLGLGSAVVGGLSVDEDPAFAGTGNFLTADEVRAGIELLPLLEGRIVISSFRIDGLELTLRSDSRGRMAIDSLVQTFPDSDGHDSRFAVLVEKASVRDARLVVERAQAAKGERTETVRMSGVDVSLDGLRFKPDLSGRARINAAVVEAGGLNLREAKAALRFDGDALHLDSVDAGLAGGRIHAQGEAGLGTERPVYKMSLHAASVNLSQLAASLLAEDTPLRISGEAELSAELSSRGGGGETLLQAAEGRGTLLASKGRLAGSPLLARIAGLTGARSFHDLDIGGSGGDFFISDGRIASPRMVLGGPGARLVVSGSVGFDSSLDLEAWVGIGPNSGRELLAVGTLLPYLKDKDGWTNIPVAVGGTMAQPKVSVPPRAMAETMIHLIPDATGRILEKAPAGSILKEGGDLTGAILKEGGDLTGAILKEGAAGIKSILGELERVIGKEKKKQP